MSESQVPAPRPEGERAGRRSELRVSDTERERAADRLRRAYADGRLSHDELEARVTAAFAAQTRGDLALLTRDLPRDSARMREAAAEAALRAHASTYVAVNTGLVGVWAVTGAGEFWPLASIVPWGAALGLQWRARRRARRRYRAS